MIPNLKTNHWHIYNCPQKFDDTILSVTEQVYWMPVLCGGCITELLKLADVFELKKMNN